MQNINTIINDNVNGATFVSISTSTDVKLLGGKKNMMQGRVRKITTGANVMVFQNKTVNGYDAMVKRRLEKEGKNPESFELSPRVWGTRLPNMPFVHHIDKNGNENYYLEVIFLNSGESHYELDGKIISADQIEGLNLDKKEGDQGGLNDKVIIRTFKLDSITSVTINKETFDGPFEFK